jgi:hypothetical protein
MIAAKSSRETSIKSVTFENGDVLLGSDAV